MELMAAISALESLTRESKVVVTTDSTYVMKGITTWVRDWKRRNWMTSSRKPVKNVDLWKRLDDAVARHEVSWEWVKGTAATRRTNGPTNWRAAESPTYGRRIPTPPRDLGVRARRSTPRVPVPG